MTGLVFNSVQLCSMVLNGAQLYSLDGVFVKWGRQEDFSRYLRGYLVGYFESFARLDGNGSGIVMLNCCILEGHKPFFTPPMELDKIKEQTDLPSTRVQVYD